MTSINHTEDRAVALCDRNRAQGTSRRARHADQAREAMHGLFEGIEDPAEKRSLARAAASQLRAILTNECGEPEALVMFAAETGRFRIKAKAETRTLFKRGRAIGVANG